MNDEERSMNHKTEIHVAVDPNGRVLGKLAVNYKETGYALPPSEEFLANAIREEMDAEIMEAIRKAVQDANKEAHE